MQVWSTMNAAATEATRDQNSRCATARAFLVSFCMVNNTAPKAGLKL